MEPKTGVYIAKKKNGTIYYRSSFTFKGRHISLGSYDSMDKANLAYVEADHLAHSAMTIENYKPHSSVLNFSKWVSIINYRDNRIYIKTPIYLKSNYFLYYISPDDIYTFDVDDLFYYSRHSIMKRGNHLFVAEYGMQVNIATRYGIKNFAAYGRDYIFMNGDKHDYRYSNIKIINTYNGVRCIDDGTDTSYTSVIHINGDFIIGRYPTEFEAAIAYNKAANFLTENGLGKLYQKNFISELSSIKYKEYYDNIELPEKIKNLFH